MVKSNYDSFQKIMRINEKYKEIFDIIDERNYEIINVLRDDNRSYVAKISTVYGTLVLKKPREKNTRKWQRFLSIFRGSVSRREYDATHFIQSLGFNVATPILACETRKCGMVVDSYYVYTFIEGTQSTATDAHRVAEVLHDIHAKGYRHDDPQLENFVVGSDDQIYMIDTILRPSIYGEIGRAYEFLYLEESCHIDICLYDRSKFAYKIARLVKIFMDWKRGRYRH